MRFNQWDINSIKSSAFLSTVIHLGVTASRLVKYHCWVANALRLLSSKTISQASGIWYRGLQSTISLDADRKLAVNYSAASSFARMPIQRLTCVSWSVFRLCPSHSQSWSQEADPWVSTATMLLETWHNLVLWNNMLYFRFNSQLVWKVERFFGWNKSQRWQWTSSKCPDVHYTPNEERLQFLTWNSSKHPIDCLTL
jgi:hypothetical protein